MKKEINRRITKQKNVILEELRKVKIHPTADSVFKMARKRIPSISFGTVYRNLNLLRDQGQILEFACGKYSCRYDGYTSNHYHFFCLSCQKVMDIDAPILNNLDDNIGKKCGLLINYHRINFYGYCKGCKPKTGKEVGHD